MKNETVISFLACFPGHYFQTLDDKSMKGADPPRDSLPELVRHGSSSAFTLDQLRELNEKGAGIFFSPNSFPQQRKKELCQGVNAWFMEIDGVSKDEQMKKLHEAPLPPSIIVESGNSYHAYWLAKDATVDGFDRIVRALIHFFDSDPACKDISRVLRIPGFFHNKREPFEVRIELFDPKNTYTEQEMLQAFPYREEVKSAPTSRPVPIAEHLTFWEAVSRLDNRIMLQRLSGTYMVNHEQFSFRPRSSGGEYIDVNGEPADCWIDENGMIGSGKRAGPTFIQWLSFYGLSKKDIAEWLKKNCSDLFPKDLLRGKSKKGGEDGESEKTATQANQMLELFQEQRPVLFRNEMDEAYVQVAIDGRKEIMKCESRRFEKYLGRLYRQETGSFINDDSLTKMVRFVTAEAEYGDQKFPLHNRVAVYDGDYWYDLGDGKAVRFRLGTWEIVQDLPILFDPQKHQEPQVIPVSHGGDVRKVFDHIHIQNPDYQMLFVIWLMTCFIPGIPHAILVLFGEKGAAKSTTLRFTKRLIDPSKAELLTMPNHDEMIQQLFHQYVLFYDNVHKIPQAVSDLLCRAVTGAGSSKRKLFTDDDEVIYNFLRVIALNGINNVVENSDLLERSLLIELSRISKKERKTESVLNAAFDHDRPLILGGIFDVLAKARVVFPTIRDTDFPRMADFAKWGCAIAEVLGYGSDAFLTAYEANLSQQNQDVLEDDPVAHTICLLMDRENSYWEGSPTQLHTILSEFLDEAKIDVREWPKTPAALGKHLNLVLSNLRDSGIVVHKVKDAGRRRGRFFTITKSTVAIDLAVAKPLNSQAACDSSDECDSRLADFKIHTLESYLAGDSVLGDLNLEDQERAVCQTFELDNNPNL